MDDNILAEKEYAKDLFRALIPLKIEWLSQTDIRIADDDVLDLAVASGMKLPVIGFESLNADSLEKSASLAKKSWRKQHEEGVRKLHRRGVMVHGGGFIFGFDRETREQHLEAVTWAIRNRLTVGQFTLATPFPGTGLSGKLHRAGRIETYDWCKYMGIECCVVKGEQGYKEALEATRGAAYRKFYSLSSVIRRFNWRLSPLNQVLWLMLQRFKGADSWTRTCAIAMQYS